ncbi:MAG: ThuA domain-containing protein [Verrucomicrobia bacterium]|nr:ThuA domain-containing protein [Verrucomicrobiota bacterium]
MKKTRLLLLTGGGFHDFKYAAAFLPQLFQNSGWFEVESTEDRDALKSLDRFDAVVFYTQGGKLSAEQEQSLTRFVASGRGFMGIHCANDSFRENAGYRAMIGSHFVTHAPEPHLYPVTISKKDHPLVAGVQEFQVVDEFYRCEFDTGLDVFLTGLWQGQTIPLAYTKAHKKGRVCYQAIGHDSRAFEHPAISQLIIRGARWAAGNWPKTIRPLRWATIGYGGSFNMGQHHLKCAALAGLQPVAVCELNPERLEVARKDFPGIRTYPKVEDLLRDPEVDGVTAIVPHNVHGPLGLQVARAGKHLVMEKPFVTKVAEADALIAAAKQSGSMLTVYHNRRWDGDFLRIEEIVRSGRIGEIFQIEACMGSYSRPHGKWWRDDKAISGGFMLDWGAHFFFWIGRLMPHPILSVDGFLHKRRWHHVTNEDHGLILVRYEGGKSASFELSFLAAIPKSPWRILGSRGGIETAVNVHGAAEGRYLKVISFGDDLVRREARVPFAVSWNDPLFNPFYSNVTSHLSVGEPLEITAEEARKVIAILEAGEKASQEGKAQPLP